MNLKITSFVWITLLCFIQTYYCILGEDVEDCRCFPTQPCWPSIEEWNLLSETVQGRLTIPVSPVDPCLDGKERKDPTACHEALENMGKDPFFLQTLSGGTESTGQSNAWTAMSSNYAIVAWDEFDIAAGVRFANKHNIRLAVKGTGHDYYGRSNAANSLLIWTHLMRDIQFHDEFAPEGSQFDNEKWKNRIPAVTMEAGLTWMDVYAAASLDRDLYVQGGWCTSVGVVGWYIGGGYGSFSKKFGTGAANLLQAKVVTSEGKIVIASEYQNSDLFYAIRGGGHGFGIIVSLTARTHPLPKLGGSSSGILLIREESGAQELVAAFLDFLQNSLTPTNWGNAITIHKYGIDIDMLFLDLTLEEAENAWQPIKDWILMRPDAYSYDVTHYSWPLRSLWNSTIQQALGDGIASPFDPSEPDRAFWFQNTGAEISAFLITYYSRYLMNSYFMEDVHVGAKKLLDLADGVADGSSVTIHLNKAQYGASQWAIDELDKTPMHPSIKNSFGLMLSYNFVSHYSPLVPYTYQNETSNISEWIDICNTTSVEECWSRIKDVNDAAVNRFREETLGSGAYFNEADYFEPDFQETFWGIKNYNTLLRIKHNWDPNGLFYCHNCVGSEEWQEGGMCRKANHQLDKVF